MGVPAALWDALDARDPPAGLAGAVARLSERYRAGVADAAPAMRDPLEHQAYLAARMPATSAAVAEALAAGLAVAGPVLERCRSALDLGSGPGSALWALVERLDLERLTAIERDPGLIASGQTLMAEGPAPLPTTTWRRGDLRLIDRLDPPIPVHDLVTCSYALGELTEPEQATLVRWLWERAGSAVLLIEPGTPRGAAVIGRARTALLAARAFIAAPCTHQGPCPLALAQAPGAALHDGPGWCHFSVRLPRSRLHRAAKGASLGYEDEPFSYLLALRDTVPLRGGRILAPIEGCKHTPEVITCSADGLVRHHISRRQRAAYGASRKARWGGRWDPPLAEGDQTQADGDQPQADGDQPHADGNPPHAG